MDGGLKMKYLVVSDNHGDRDVLVNIAEHWQQKVAGMFHCGDSELEVTDELWRKFVVVKGNCDYDPKYEVECVIKTDDIVFYMTHGHLFNVNTSLNHLALSAKEKGANIVLYGHTHKLFAEMEQNILFLNPGSISQPRGKYSHLKTYAIIEVTEKEIKVTYHDRSHQVIPELSLVFNK